MELEQHVKKIIQDSISVKKQTVTMSADITRAALKLASCLENKHKILTCGNGGSAGDAQHFSSEMLNRFERERRALPAIALTCDNFTLTSIANDYNFDDVFAKQIDALGQNGDTLLAITTSGNSANILKAVKIAHKKSMNIIALTGKDGGKLKYNLTTNDIELRVMSNSTARIQEVHLLIIHCLCDIIDKYLFD
jgi:D-sedoheptulose 7-phosphate isomerase